MKVTIIAETVRNVVNIIGKMFHTQNIEVRRQPKLCCAVKSYLMPLRQIIPMRLTTMFRGTLHQRRNDIRSLSEWYYVAMDSIRLGDDLTIGIGVDVCDDLRAFVIFPRCRYDAYLTRMLRIKLGDIPIRITNEGSYVTAEWNDVDKLMDANFIEFVRHTIDIIQNHTIDTRTLLWHHPACA